MTSDQFPSSVWPDLFDIGSFRYAFERLTFHQPPPHAAPATRGITPLKAGGPTGLGLHRRCYFSARLQVTLGSLDTNHPSFSSITINHLEDNSYPLENDEFIVVLFVVDTSQQRNQLGSHFRRVKKASEASLGILVSDRVADKKER